jgi:hypothetical protein
MMALHPVGTALDASKLLRSEGDPRGCSRSKSLALSPESNDLKKYFSGRFNSHTLRLFDAPHFFILLW